MLLDQSGFIYLFIIKDGYYKMLFKGENKVIFFKIRNENVRRGRLIFFDELPMCKASFSNRKCIFIVSVYKEFHKYIPYAIIYTQQ